MLMLMISVSTDIGEGFNKQNFILKI